MPLFHSIQFVKNVCKTRPQSSNASLYPIDALVHIAHVIIKTASSATATMPTTVAIASTSSSTPFLAVGVTVHITVNIAVAMAPLTMVSVIARW